MKLESWKMPDFSNKKSQISQTVPPVLPRMGPDGPGYCVPLMVSGNEMLNINCRLSMHCSFPFRLQGTKSLLVKKDRLREEL